MNFKELIKSWYWSFKGLCFYCGGQLKPPYSVKIQECSVCGKRN